MRSDMLSGVLRARNTFAYLVPAIGLIAAGHAQELTPPESGPVEILPIEQVTAGMKAVAWTTFEGREPEPMPIEILGKLTNAWGPGQDIIMAKVGGRGERTKVAGGMSGSPVYHDGKLLGAIALRFGSFTADAIAGITPIELMLEIQEFDQSRPQTAAASPEADAVDLGAEHDLAAQVWAHSLAEPEAGSQLLTPIDTPLTFSGIADGAIDLFGGHFRRLGFSTVQGGAVAGSATVGSTDVDGALRPGEPIAAVMMRGDMSATALGTVSYNDGKRVLAFGHPLFNSGPIEAPIATANIVHVLASAFSPVKIANAGDIVGALRQDRHSGIMGVLGETARLIPVHVEVNTYDDNDALVKSSEFNYEIFQNQKLTAQILMLALYNSMFGLNDFSSEATFRLKLEAEFEGADPVSFETLQSVSRLPVPAPLLLASAVASRIQRVLANPIDPPAVEGLDVTIDLLPQRRVAAIEQLWVERRVVRPGETLKGKVFLQRFQGETKAYPFEIEIPAGAGKGRLTLMASDAAALDRRRQMAVARGGTLNTAQTVSLLNQERSNDRVYVSLLARSLTAHIEDRSFPNVPATVLAVMRDSAQGRMMIEPQSPQAQVSIAAEAIVGGRRTLTIEVR